jgi:hypothetical protein
MFFSLAVQPQCDVEAQLVSACDRDEQTTHSRITTFGVQHILFEEAQ